jgi:flagellar assembly protein FliH
LSRLIKSGWATPEQSDQRIISIKTLFNANIEEGLRSETTIEIDKDEILANAQLEANNLVRQAKDEAERVKEQINLEKQHWEQELQRLRMIAEQEGFEQGVMQGRDQGLLEFQDIIQTAQEVVVASKNEYQKQVESADETILNIALAVAEKIINQKLEDREQFIPIVKKALKDARDYREIQLHIHPTHYGFLLSHKDELMGLFPRETDFYLYPDDSLSEWSCIIESSNGRIDASVDSQLVEIKRMLQEILESE